MLFETAYSEDSSKHRDYFEIYNELFANNNINRLDNYNILEIGIDLGSGLRALKRFFPNSKIVGLDIKPECKQFEEENIEVVIGSQVDNNILNYLCEKKFDIIIDDGSHDNNHVFYTFDYLFKYLNNQRIGIYIIEDIHTSYWPYYNGGYKNDNSTIEKCKNLIDMQSAWCIRDPISCHNPPYKGNVVNKTYYEEWLHFIQFYDNIIVIKKKKNKARCSKPI